MRAFNLFRVIFTVWICSVSFISWAEPVAKPDQEVTVEAVLDKTSVTIGDKIRYSLVVSAKNDI